jgi:hypothetical protein
MRLLFLRFAALNPVLTGLLTSPAGAYENEGAF